MDDMNEQSAPQAGSPTGNETGSHGGPRVTGDQMRDVDRLRRSSTDRYIAGVAGGLGRHFDIDPTIIRVLLVVLTLFGGAGVLVYGAVWLFVPEDGQPHAPIEVSTDVRRVILIAAGVIALSIVFGTPFFGNSWGNGFPVPLLVIGVVAIVLIATRGQRRQSRLQNQPPPPWGTDPYAAASYSPAPSSSAQFSSAQSSAPEGTPMTATDPRVDPGQQPPAWMPPTAPTYVLPPRPRRTGLVLFWPTVALIAIALGTLGILDTSSSVPVSAYAALAVAITSVMLVVGAFVGRPGGLIALGLVSSMALAVTSIVGAADDGSGFDSKDLRDVPASAAALEPSYHTPTGTIEIDLTRIRDLAALNGRTVDIGTNAGEITVIVPNGLNVHVAADIRYAGQINIGDEMRDGLGQSLDSTLTTSTTPGTPVLDLDVEVRFGQITVRQP
jgi:phage shock protein PspC (stress-responsive transcriptional regulator)